MEKTLRILKQEAYLEGYKDARDMLAREIEDMTIIFPHRAMNGEYLTEPIAIMAELRTRFATMARGNKPLNEIKPQGELKPCYFCQGEGILQSGEECSCFTKSY